MKFRNHKTGEVYDSMVKTPCPTHNGCGTCEYKPFVGESCTDFCRNHPSEAAHLMGYEVVEDKEEAMEKKDKPRICEVLGVEVGERFGIEYRRGQFWFDETGHMNDSCDSATVWDMVDLINHPDHIIRKPSFTEEEMVVLNALQRAGVTEIEHGAGCNTLEAKSRIFEDGDDCYREGWFLPKDLLPSLRPGQSVQLEDTVEGGA